MQDQSDNNGEAPQVTSAAIPRVIMVTVRSVMEKGDLAKIQIRTDATVRELRMACFHVIGPKCEQQSLLFDGKELKDDDKTLVDYGLGADCSVLLAPRMSTGIRDTRPRSDVVLIVPDIIPDSVQTMADLRDALRGMTSLPTKPAPQMTAADRNAHSWTPEKQMEHEVTRNRMKELMKRRRNLRSANKPAMMKAISSEASQSHVANDSSKHAGSHSPTGIQTLGDTGSICGSIGRSPLASEPGTPPELRAARNLIPTTTSSTTTVEPKEPAIIPVTEKELKLYFNPPETVRQAEMLRRDLYNPPQNREELQRIKNHFKELKKSNCGVCRRRLPLIQQSIKCRCGKVFCTKHRNAESHKCSVDYKLAGRKKLEKEIPKLQLGGPRKAKEDEA